MSGTIHGKPGLPVAELGRLEKILKAKLSPRHQYLLAKKLLRRQEYTSRNIAVRLLISGWPGNKDIETLIKVAANDPDWIVREYAAGTFAALLEKDFAHFAKTFSNWVRTETVNVKRAIALAVKYDAKSGAMEKWKVYFHLINCLMAEKDEYIRKNLGPFAIGDGLLSRFPKQILHSCRKWSKSPNENIRWNTAMIFTAAAAGNFIKEGRPILRELEMDPSPFVARAAKRAIKNLEKRGGKR